MLLTLRLCIQKPILESSRRNLYYLINDYCIHFQYFPEALILRLMAGTILRGKPPTLVFYGAISLLGGGSVDFISLSRHLINF